MMVSTMIEHSTNERNQLLDNLTRIKGISQNKQQWLRAWFNIRVFRDLARLSVEQIELRLKAEGKAVSKEEIAAWIVQAEALSVIAERSREENHDLESWQSVASWQVELQSRQVGEFEEQRAVLRDLATDCISILPEAELELLREWMRYDLPHEATEPVEIPEAVPESEEEALYFDSSPAISHSPVRVQIDSIQVWQSPQQETPQFIYPSNRSFPGMLESNKRFTLDIAFQLKGLHEREQFNTQASYLAQVYVRDRATGVITSLGCTQLYSLFEAQSTYTAQLLDANIARKGVYSLQVLVRAQGIPTIPGYFEMPLLQVV
ncbi:hypothetical protein IQ249_10460 [Lusitaniella coriacea LEGE 07157]|uniref:Uncharacterized protein n=1 Tax=Lusitaniella coriacea LEGE 07157 TaxID=945747 RepID=A0A8J7DW85_9CYAN|nr:hypothetical protein [Lusitaniella coriacea]MBE9116319.1 hypothetical protein [Lusitaniella coriacea LEGE 07157]